MSRNWFSPSVRILISQFLCAALVVLVLAFEPPMYMGDVAAEILEIAGFALLIVAAFGRVWSTAFVGGRKNREIATDGPYSIVRNPLYVFSFIGAVGFGLTVSDPILAAALGLFFGIYYHFVVRGEEAYLSRTFPDTYPPYLASTPRWIPNLKLFHEPAAITVDTKRLRKGIVAAMWFAWVIVLWEIVRLVQTTIAHRA